MQQLHLPSSFFSFIDEHSSEDPSRLRLKWQSEECSFDVPLAITQIECRRKCRTKLGRFLSNSHFIFPDSISSEQSSHQAVALYHANFGEPGKTLLDMTAGLGIDAISFAERGLCVTACELDERKAAALLHNSLLHLSGRDEAGEMKVRNEDSVGFLKECGKDFDIIFIDPARRGEGNKRMYNFRDCLPDITAIQEEVKARCRLLLIKASPLLDITQTLMDLKDVKEIHCVSVGGECKEVLVAIRKDDMPLRLTAVDLDNDGELVSEFSFNATATPPLPEYADEIPSGGYLYEPNASMMKLGAWGELQNFFPGLRKLSANSHLFVSEIHYECFPGRKMRIEKTLTKKDRKSLKGFPVNIVSRNHPQRAEELRKILGVKEGKEKFLYATRLGETPVMILCERIDQKR